MRKITVYIILLIIISVSLAYAHGPSGHQSKVELTQEQISKRASIMVGEIAKGDELAASWAQIKPSEVKKRTYKGTSEWVVIYDNPKETDPSKRKLYIFLSIYGDFAGANHTDE
jgi:hypothetical protein